MTTTRDMTLTEFVLARVAEDEQGTAPVVDRMLTGVGHAELAGFAGQLFTEWRRLATTNPGSRTLRAIAAVYASHPDYDEAWANH